MRCPGYCDVKERLRQAEALLVAAEDAWGGETERAEKAERDLEALRARVREAREAFERRMGDSAHSEGFRDASAVAVLELNTIIKGEDA